MANELCYSENMKVTKYPQSCLLLEKDGKRIVMDPGRFFTEKYSVSELGELEAILYTHQHGDHYDQKVVDELGGKVKCIYGNKDVSKLIGEHACVVTSGSGFSVAGFEIMPRDLPHFPIGQEVPQNTGYLIDGTFFHPGDGVENPGITVVDLAAPVAGGFTFDDVKEFARSLSAKRVIPIHYSNQQMYPVDIKEFETVMNEFEVITLADGESTEL